MKTKLFLYLLILLGLFVPASAQTAVVEHSNYYTTGMQYYDNKNFGEAFQQFKQGAEQGLADAQNALGDCYYDGEGVAKDFKQAVYWYKMAADQGYADAQYNLGYCYQQGEGIEKDLTMAARLFEKAADQGHADAQSAVGECYYEGEGVNKDLRAAFYWFNKAAFQDQIDGMYSLGYCYLNGEGTDVDVQRGISWLKQAAEQGHVDAQYQLGCCYADGEVVNQDLQAAKNWFEKAATQGHEEAIEALAELKPATTQTAQTSKPAATQTAQASQSAASSASKPADDGAPKATKAELAALKKFMASMAGHTYQCSKYSVGEPIDYILSSGGMQLIQSVKFVSKTKATISTTLKLNSSASRMSPTAYQMKSEMESSRFNFTGAVTTSGPYLVITNSNSGSEFKFKPREGTLKLETPGGNIFKKIK